MNASSQSVERRRDLTSRAFVTDVILYLQAGGEPANALMNMNERGVPRAVQLRVLNGEAVADPKSH